MIFTETRLKGAFIIDLEKLEDNRGFFSRSWCSEEMNDHGLNARIEQANISFNNKKGTLRGLHYQKHPFQEAKYVRCTRGSIFDVIVDLRQDSPTFLQWIGIELSQENYRMLSIPEDFANGFITLEDNSEVNYFMTQMYTPGAQAGIRWNDPGVNIKWPIEPTVLSEKDKSYPDFTSLGNE